MSIHATGGPACGACVHLDREALEMSLMQGETVPTVAARYGLSAFTIRNHRDKHLLPDLAAVEGAAEKVRAGNILVELRRHCERVALLSDACDEYLRDPVDPSRYDVGARAEEVTVIYVEEGADGQPVRKKATLAELLAKVDAGGMDVRRVEIKHADPRDLLLKCYDRQESHQRLIGQLVGLLKSGGDTTINLSVHPVFVKVQQVIQEVLAPYPGAPELAAEKFRALEALEAGK